MFQFHNNLQTHRVTAVQVTCDVCYVVTWLPGATLEHTWHWDFSNATYCFFRIIPWVWPVQSTRAERPSTFYATHNLTVSVSVWVVSINQEVDWVGDVSSISSFSHLMVNDCMLNKTEMCYMMWSVICCLGPLSQSRIDSEPDNWSKLSLEQTLLLYKVDLKTFS